MHETRLEPIWSPHRRRRTKNEGKMEAKGLEGSSNEWRLINERRKENWQNLQEWNQLKENYSYWKMRFAASMCLCGCPGPLRGPYLGTQVNVKRKGYWIKYSILWYIDKSNVAYNFPADGGLQFTDQHEESSTTYLEWGLKIFLWGNAGPLAFLLRLLGNIWGKQFQL